MSRIDGGGRASAGRTLAIAADTHQHKRSREPRPWRRTAGNPASLVTTSGRRAASTPKATGGGTNACEPRFAPSARTTVRIHPRQLLGAAGGKTHTQSRVIRRRAAVCSSLRSPRMPRVSAVAAAAPTRIVAIRSAASARLAHHGPGRQVTDAPRKKPPGTRGRACTAEQPSTCVRRSRAHSTTASSEAASPAPSASRLPRLQHGAATF